MSNKLILIAVAVAVLLGGVTLLVLNRGGGGAAGAGEKSGPVILLGEKLMDLDPAEVQAMVVMEGGSPSAKVTVSRKGAGVASAWTIAAGAPGAVAWRADPTRVRSMLDILASVRAAATPPVDARVGDGATTVRLELEGGKTKTLRLAARTLGGQGLVEVSEEGNAPGRTALVSDQIHSAFTSPGPLGWRDTQLIPAGSPLPSRIRLTGGGSSTLLGQMDGRWMVREPVSAPADSGAVQRVIGQVQGLRISKFLDAASGGAPPPPSAAAAGLENPVARIALETDTRVSGSGDPTLSVTTSRTEVLVGGKADAAGTSYYVSTDGGTSIVVVGADLLGKIGTRPEAYLAAVISAVPAQSVGVVMFRGSAAETDSPTAPGTLPAAPPIELGFRRQMATWVELRSDGTEVALDPKRLSEVDELLSFLTTRPSAQTTLEAPAGYQAVGTLTLRDKDGDPLEELEVGRSGAPGVTVRTGRVYRAYPAPPALVVSVLGPIEAKAATDETGQPIRDPIK